MGTSWEELALVHSENLHELQIPIHLCIMEASSSNSLLLATARGEVIKQVRVFIKAKYRAEADECRGEEPLAK